jgi:hypothetical protein
MIDTYKKKLVQVETILPDLEDGLSRQVFDNVEQFMASYNESRTIRKGKDSDQAEMAVLDIREQMYGILDNMHGYWSQFGFMDLASSNELHKVVDNVFRHVKLQKEDADQEHADLDGELIK